MEIRVVRVARIGEGMPGAMARTLENTPFEGFRVDIQAEGIMDGWPVTIPAAAIDTRKAVYGIESDDEALEAILREQGMALHSLVHNLDTRVIRELDNSCEYLDWKESQGQVEEMQPQGQKMLHAFGGTHDAIDVSYSAEAKKQRDAILKQHADRASLPDRRVVLLEALAQRPADGSESPPEPEPERFGVAFNQPQAEPPTQELAVQVREQLEQDGERTVDEIAEALDEDPATISRVLDEFEPHEQTVRHVGPGKGGGWLATEGVT